MISLGKVVVAVAALLLATASFAQSATGLSTSVGDSRLLAVQRKVEQLFQNGKYERAFFIYRNELAPNGDKYAQYMVGYMFQSGTGVERDPIQAAAWYRLSAERGTPEFVTVYEQSIENFTTEQMVAAGIRYNALRNEYGDLVILLNLIKEDMRTLRSRTGSIIGSDVAPMSVIEAGSGRIQTGADYYRRIEERLERTVRTLVKLGGLEDVDVNVQSIDIRDLERKVRAVLERHD